MPTTGPDASPANNLPAANRIRLQKFLSASGICSRRKGEQYISEGKVTVNGRIVTTPGTKIDPVRDAVAVSGKPVVPDDEKHIYIALHKPEGVITSCSHKGSRIVTDLVDIPERVYPVGRLDKNSSGLLLMTNDGELHNRLSHPSFDHEKEYIVSTSRPLSDGDLKQLADGVVVLGRKTRSAVVRRLSGSRFRIVLKEGRNRQIRRMVEKIGAKVVTLKRVRMANLELGDLSTGQWRYLTPEEINRLLR